MLQIGNVDLNINKSRGKTFNNFIFLFCNDTASLYTGKMHKHNTLSTLGTKSTVRL